ncbi:hypothetical protein HPT29_028430 (plasmid) [Microvirga terrae]|uniref:DUF4190 domain-containing protein n=1 Tax=Microvirga terrae TaxID=2740529 RepID=A0ABY5S320_9HYPH|nr:hypothetical protein [Microvirga terrae]UVF22881.1 hypothetical protein HPT29_028430 [Microvirga terrae]
MQSVVTAALTGALVAGTFVIGHLVLKYGLRKPSPSGTASFFAGAITWAAVFTAYVLVISPAWNVFSEWFNADARAAALEAKKAEFSSICQDMISKGLTPGRVCKEIGIE